MELINSPMSIWIGWIVAFAIASSMATWLGSGKSIKGEIQELRTELRSEIQDVACGLNALGESVGDLRERVAKIEAFMETIQWGDQGDLTMKASSMSNRRNS